MGHPRRHYEPGFVWHLTQRCHDRKFLFQYATHRKRWTELLYDAQDRHDVPILNFTVTSNHIHLLVVAPEDRDGIPKMMQLISSRIAKEYNRGHTRSGAFWEGRYRATAVESGEHLVGCCVYIDLNMVRAGVVNHPREWEHSGYHEIVRPKKRYRLVNRDELIRLMAMKGIPDFAAHYNGWIREKIATGKMGRESMWSTELAVGSESFVKYVKKNLLDLSLEEGSRTTWKEQPAGYGEEGAEASNELPWEVYGESEIWE
jgi:putative transposase